jgi:hypothetical protein
MNPYSIESDEAMKRGDEARRWSVKGFIA